MPLEGDKEGRGGSKNCTEHDKAWHRVTPTGGRGKKVDFFHDVFCEWPLKRMCKPEVRLIWKYKHKRKKTILDNCIDNISQRRIERLAFRTLRMKKMLDKINQKPSSTHRKFLSFKFNYGNKERMCFWRCSFNMLFFLRFYWENSSTGNFSVMKTNRIWNLSEIFYAKTLKQLTVIAYNLLRLNYKPELLTFSNFATVQSNFVARNRQLHRQQEIVENC